MKKKILIIVVLLAIIAVVLFAYQSKINNEIIDLITSVYSSLEGGVVTVTPAGPRIG